MEEKKELQPRWLKPLLEAKFYSLCESHGLKNTFFCLDCGGLLLCEEGMKAKQHEAHQILQVYKASHQVVIKIDDIDKLLDVSCIQPYINNNNRVVYINQRRQKDQQPNNSNGNQKKPNNSNSMPKCKTCGWQLLIGSTSKLCSIECRYNVEGGSRSQPNKINSERMSFKPSNPYSYRKRSRKGVPQRAPFF